MGEEICLDDVRPQVRAFAVAMERTLRANSHKGDRSAWLAEPPEHHLERLWEECYELRSAVAANTNADGSAREPNRMTPLRRADLMGGCTDVANFCMMIADVFGLLGDGT